MPPGVAIRRVAVVVTLLGNCALIWLGDTNRIGRAAPFSRMQLSPRDDVEPVKAWLTVERLLPVMAMRLPGARLSVKSATLTTRSTCGAPIGVSNVQGRTVTPEVVRVTIE